MLLLQQLGVDVETKQEGTACEDKHQFVGARVYCRF